MLTFYLLTKLYLFKINATIFDLIFDLTDSIFILNSNAVC